MGMTKGKMANRHSPAVRAHTVRMVFKHKGSYVTQAGAIAVLAPKLGCIPQTLRKASASFAPAIGDAGITCQAAGRNTRFSESGSDPTGP